MIEIIKELKEKYPNDYDFGKNVRILLTDFTIEAEKLEKIDVKGEDWFVKQQERNEILKKIKEKFDL